MIQYQSTPDYYRDYIEHGWLKDQAAKAHKYIERWRGKNGKWYYRYKSKAQELGAKANRVIRGFKSDEVSDNTLNEYRGPVVNAANRRIVGTTRHYINWGKDPGKAGSRDTALASKRSQPYVETTRVNRPKTKNLTKRGYSGSQGSGESKRQRNLGTRRDYQNRNTESKFDGARRLARAHDRIRKKDKRLDSQLKNAYTKTKKNTKVELHSNGAIYNNISSYDADRILTSRGYPSASSWEKDVQRNNKATNKSVKKKKRTGTRNKLYIKKNSTRTTRSGKRVPRSKHIVYVN